MKENRKKLIRLACYIFAVVLLMTLSVIIIFVSFLDVHEAYKADIVRKTAPLYGNCQGLYHSKYNKFAIDMDLLECEFSKDVKIYQTEAEFRKDYPDLCITVSLGVSPDSFSVIVAGNVDGKDKFRYVDNNKGIGDPVCYR